MKKSTKITIALIIAIAIIAVIAIILISSKSSENIDVNSQEDLENLMNKVYDGVTADLYNVETRSIDLSDSISVQSYTGLENGDDLEYAVVSEPLINAQPYSFILAKVRDGVNANNIANEMSEKVDPRKWICVSASKIYATSSGNCVFLVMGGKDSSKLASSAYENFKNIAQTIGKEYTKNLSDDELPLDAEGTGIFQVPSSEQ